MESIIGEAKKKAPSSWSSSSWLTLDEYITKIRSLIALWENKR
jgi:hypothetical protein